MAVTMYRSPVLLAVLLLFVNTSRAAYWSGIAVVGMNNLTGQVVVPGAGTYERLDNFGIDKSADGTAGTACNCKFYTSGGFYRYKTHSLYEADPRDDSTRLITNLTEPRRLHSMTCISPDSLIICGGVTNDDKPLKSCEICHVKNPLCVPIFPMPKTLECHSAVYSDGNLYLVGGNYGGISNKRLLVYSLIDQSWAEKAWMSKERDRYPGVILLTNGHILVCGGRYEEQPLNTCESYDPERDAWTPKANMKVARSYFNLVRFENRVYAVGAFQFDSGFQTVESYDEYYDVWTMETAQLTRDSTANAAGVIDHSCVSDLIGDNE